MGLLSDSDFQFAKPKAQPKPSPQGGVQPGATAPSGIPGIPASSTPTANPLNFKPQIKIDTNPLNQKVVAPKAPVLEHGVPVDTGAAVRIDSPLSSEDQIKKFGGVIGSPEYLQHKADNPYSSYLPRQLMSTVGLRLPSEQEWDTMSMTDKTATVAKAGTNAAMRMVSDLPKAAVRGVLSVASTAYAGIRKPIVSNLSVLENEKKWDLPWVGEVGNLYQNYGDARKSGMSRLAASLMAGPGLFLDAATIGPAGEIFKNTFTPKSRVGPTGELLNTKPIQAAIDAEGIAVNKRPSQSEYYSLRKSDAKQFGGTDKDIKWKFVPDGDNAISLSVVKSLPAKFKDKVGEFIKTEYGLKQIVQGDFGPEVHLTNQKIKSQNTGPVPFQSTPSKETLYHGTRVPIRNEKGLFSLTPKKAIAENYANGAGGLRSLENPDFRVYEAGDKDGIYKFISDKNGISYQRNDGKTLSPYDIESLQRYGQASPKSPNAKIYEFNLPEDSKILQLDSPNSYNGYSKNTPGTKLLSTLDSQGNKYAKVIIDDAKNNGAFNWSNTKPKPYQDAWREVIIPQLEQKGYTGIRYPDEGDMTTAVFDVNKLDDLSSKITKSEVSAPVVGGEKKPVFIIPEARKGLEKRPITNDQIGTLSQIGQMKNIPPEVRDAVIKTLTGKSTLGELTEADYVKAVGALSKWGEKYSDVVLATDIPQGPLSRTRSYVSPQRHYFDHVEDKFGIPLKSKVYEPMERAAQMSKVLDSQLQPELEGIFGEYAKSKYVDERRLVDAYARGDTAAILENTSLTPAVKADLARIGDELIKWDDTYGEILGVGRDIYKENYGGPKISNIGGTVPQYKDLDVMPGKEFFAKYKRKGSLDPFIDDPLASRQIYIKEGSKALHYGPALKDFESLIKSGAIPPEMAKHANSYVQEKLGRLGGMEKIMDSFVPTLNKKLGLNLPADATRQAVSYGLSSMYSGLVGTPSAIFKQTFQLPTFVYARLGTEFAGEAIVKSMKKSERDRVAKLGYLNEISLPYGAELAKDFNPVGMAGNAFKKGTQTIMKPLTAVDNDIRIKTFLQAEAQWNSALGKFERGEMPWNQLEKKLDFGAFSKADRDTIRQNLVSGKKDIAFNTYMREILDETSFPYRTGAGARVGYGLTGKLATGLLNYTIESTNVLARWIGTGQWDKLIRFAGNARLVTETLKETFGSDFSDTLYQKPMGITSPTVGLIENSAAWLKGIVTNNRDEMNKNSDEIVRTLRNSLPAGVVTSNAQKFFKSYKAGADSDGKYTIYDSKGKNVYNGSFNELFWGTLMGFPINEKMNERGLYQDILNRKTEYAEIQAELGQMMRDGDYDAMQKLIEKTGVNPPQGATNSQYIPRAQRAFQGLDARSKADFADRVFPD
jgi:hypothetical protein